jgi:altronate hydrolase
VTAPVLLRLHDDDPVAVARRAITAGERLAGLSAGAGLSAATDVPAGHKVALRPIAAGEAVRKYGQVIGRATCDIAAGSHVHTHNLAMLEFTHPDAAAGPAAPAPVLPAGERATFSGIVRADGRVATRNYIGVLTTVNCSATAARRIADTMTLTGELDDYPNVDGILALTHKTGCGMAGDGPGFELLRRTLAGYARHANFAALLVVGLGCEVNQVAALTDSLELPEGVPLHAMTIQELGGTKHTVAAGLEQVRALLPEVNAVRRESVPASELVLGLQCGGSDGWSGITANPALGYASDLLVRNGGTSILSETPEIYGAEHLLTARAATPQVAAQLLERIRWWERYTADNGGSMDNNPSPGNKAGGLTTILEKSLGAVAKGGTSVLSRVYEYAQPVDGKGFAFMDTPGYDPVSVTGQVAGGANVICFTTGRGSAFGAKPAPSIKLATNTAMYQRMSGDMDLDCGTILADRTVAEVGAEIFELILQTASGHKTNSELLGCGDEEFNPWQLGAVM